MKMKNGKSAAKQIVMKPIAGWEGLYEITEDGKVYSLKRNIFLKPRLSMDGYNRVCLCNDKFRREYRVARLVAETFLEKPIDKTQVNHKDYNRQNDTMDNLEWVTDYENTYYSFKEDRFLIPETYKVYTFTNVYNGKAFSIIGINNVGSILAILISFLNNIFIPMAITIIPPRKLMSEIACSVKNTFI